MNAVQRESPWPRLMWGLLLVTAGTIFWLDQIDRLNARDYLRWWPVALVAIGVSHLPERRWLAAAVWIGIGGLLLLPKLGFPHLNIGKLFALWPLLISIGGLTLVTQALRRRPPGTAVSATAVMAGNVRTLGTQDLSSVDVVAVMGGCELDFSSAKSATGEVTINVLAFWGGIEIKVPAGWQVVDHVAEILAGVEIKTGPTSENAPRVIVRGSAIMGGVEVTSAEAAA